MKKVHPIILSIYIRTLIDHVEPENRTKPAIAIKRVLEAAEYRWALKHDKRYYELLQIAIAAWHRIQQAYGEKGKLADTEVLVAGLYFYNQDGFKRMLKVKPTHFDTMMDQYYRLTPMANETVSQNAVDQLIYLTEQETPEC